VSRGTPASTLDRLNNGGGSLHVSLDDVHRRTLASEQLGNAPANAGTGARYHSAFLFQAEHSCAPV
jgi:hypothetical protein